MGKFDSLSDEGIFLGYSFTSKAYRVYNKRTIKVMETVNVVIDESSNSSFEKGIEELTKAILPPEPRVVQEITSLGSLSKMVLSLLSLFTPMIRRLICSLSLLMAKGLNSYAKTLV